MAEPLTAVQRRTLLEALAPFHHVIERVDIYGSRVRGDHRVGSDVDLMIAGAIDHRLRSRIAGAVDDSWLSIHADVGAYALLAPGSFADRVRHTARPLFSAGELAAAASDLAA